MFDVSGGSHRTAIHQSAALPLHLPKEKYQFKKLVSVVSWIGFLVSAVSEYGFDVDFPLTPPVWLAIAVCAVVMAAAHAGIGSRVHGIGKRETVTYLSSDVPSPSDSASFISNGNAGRPTTPVGDCRATAPVAISLDGRISASRALALQFLVCVAASDTIPSLIFLSPAVTRGPPSSDNQIDRTLGRPARPGYSAPLSSEIHLHDPSTARNASLNGTDQTPIRSAIVGAAWIIGPYW